MDRCRGVEVADDLFETTDRTNRNDSVCELTRTNLAKQK
jgi:hypothetical protein